MKRWKRESVCECVCNGVGEPVLGKAHKSRIVYGLWSAVGVCLQRPAFVFLNAFLLIGLAVEGWMIGTWALPIVMLFGVFVNFSIHFVTSVRIHHSVKDWGARFDREGVSTILEDEYGFYRRIEMCSWNEVESVVITSKCVFVYRRKDKSGMFSMYVLDVEEGMKDNIVMLWKEYLDKNYGDEKVAIPYTENEEQQLIRLMSEDFGQPFALYRQKVAKYVYTNILVYAPTEEREYWTITTFGAGARAMKTTQEDRLKSEVSEYAEYVMYMPKNWVKSEREIHESKNWWVVTLLGGLAALPFSRGTFLAFGNVVETDELYHVALLCPERKVVQTMVYSLPSGKSIEFFQVLKLSPSEYAKYTENEEGFDMLLNTLFPEFDEKEACLEISRIAEKNMGV